MKRSLLRVLALALAAAPVVAAGGARAEEGLPVPVGGSLQNPAFSPAGSKLLFTSFSNGYNVGPAALYVYDLAAGSATELTSAPDSDSVNLPGSAWNGATSRVVLSSDRVDREEIWTVAATGGDEVRVTNHSGSTSYYEPSFSPDGAWIVFEERSAGDRGSLWKVRAEGTDATPLSDGAAGGFDDREPNWSPLGDHIVFQRLYDGGDWDLYTMAPDGNGVTRLTSEAGDDTDPSWSPEGRWVVYSSDTDLPLAKLWVVPSTGGVPERFTFSAGRYDGAPSWSPDGLWVAYESSLGDPGVSPGTKLWRTDAPGLIFADGFETGDTSGWGSQPRKTDQRRRSGFSTLEG